MAVLCTVVCAGSAFSPAGTCDAQEASFYVSEKERKEEILKKKREKEKKQKQNSKIFEYLEKARQERGKKNFKAARSYGKKALKLQEDNRLALAFLEQLDKEEELYEQEKELKEKEKEAAKLAKQEAKQRAKEEKLAKQRAKKEALEGKKGKALAAERAKKISYYLEKAEQLLNEKKFAEAYSYTQKALSIEPDNREAQEILNRIEQEEAPSVEKPPVEAPPVEAPPVEKPPAEKPPEKAVKIEGKEIVKLKPGKPIIVDGDMVEYFEEEGKIIASGNVSVTYGDVKLTCDRIEVNTSIRQALCEGNVRIEQAEGTLTGDRIRYDFGKKEGEIIGGEVSAFPWFGQSEETAKVGKNEYLLHKGYISTCDLNKPHYRIKAKEIRVFPDDKIIAKNVVFYIGKVPVLWFPYYYHPIIQSRAKVQFIPGVNSDWGYFLLSAWRFYIKGNTKVDALLDYREKKGFAAGANLYYNGEDFGLKGLGGGLLRAYFINQNGWGTYNKTSFRDEGTSSILRDRFQWKHRIDFDPGTVGIVEFNKMSDKDVLKDYFYNEYEESDPTPPNYVSFVSSKSNYTFSVEANKRFNKFATVVQRLPELKLDVPNQRLWETPFYYSTDMSGTIFNKEYSFGDSPSEKVNRFDSSHRLTYVTHLGPLNLAPYGTFRGTAYSREKTKQKITARGAIGAGIDSFMRFHRIFNVATNAFGLEINGLRHIIVPSVNYFYVHKPTVDRDKLFQMDEIDTIDKENGFTLSVENKLQTKRDIGGELKSTDLLRSIVSVDYLFRMKKNSFAFQDDHRFETLKFDLEFSPYSWLYIDSEMEIETENQSLKTGSVEASVHPWDSFRIDMGYRYEKKMPDPRNQFTFDLSYVLNSKWRLDLYERFDLQSALIEEQQLSIVRDLHCWEVELTYDLKGGNFIKDDFSMWLAFKIKAFPDLYIGLNRSFTKRPPGSPKR
ncbi:LPS assembly protein LptD [Candidatus Omnitrophota bacterium]